MFVVNRRHFVGDTRRYFVGEVMDCTEQIVRVRGYIFVPNMLHVYERRPEVRTRLFALSDGRMIMNLITESAMLDKVQFVNRGNRLHITDGDSFDYDIDEFKQD